MPVGDCEVMSKYSNYPDHEPLTPKIIKRNLLRFMGVNLPNEMLDTVEDVKVTDDGKFSCRFKAKINTKDWKIGYGSII